MKMKQVITGLLLGCSLATGVSVLAEAAASPFHSSRIDKNITRIRDNTGDMMYLVEGSKQAALIDTGVGVGSLKEYVRTLTDKPVLVILTHGHVDHASGAAEFDQVYLSKEDQDLYREHNPLTVRKGYIQGTNPQWFPTIAESDYIPPQGPERYEDLSAGKSFDLGGVNLDIYALPGHTQGMRAVLIRQNRALLTGDGANMFTFLFSKEALGLSSYERSLKALQHATAGKYDKVYCSHGSGDLSVDYLQRLIEDCEQIKSGKDDHVPFEFMGQKAAIAFAIGPDHNRLDGGIGNIVYDPMRIDR
jgi:glyoxylase-like metal-dependent hydrolase (beta-lactamase superfamily II)